MKNKYKLIYYGFEFTHHFNKQGGYHHIKDYIQYDEVIDLQKEKYFFDIILNKNIFLKFLKKIYFIFFDQIGVISLIKSIFYIKFRKNVLFHFIYPENTYAWLHYFKNNSNKICCTFHQPISFYESSKKWKKIIKNIDIIIVLSESDVAYFKNITKKENVYYIPHGINTNFFNFDVSVKKDNDILMVGNWLRDFDFANKVFEKILKINLVNKIKVVTNRENFIYFNNLSIELFENITDDHLKSLYQESKIIFFPLVNFTANNALLEAASTGSKILVSTNIEDSSFYFPNTLIFKAPNSIEIVINRIHQILNEDLYNPIFCNDIHNYCEQNYSWLTISKRTLNIFNQF